MIPEKVKNLLKKEETIFLATSSKDATPNLVAVESCGRVDGNKVLIADCHMGKTAKNLKENNKVSILATDEEEYFQIKGTSEYQTEGEHFDRMSEKLKGTEYTVKGMVVITCKEIYDLQRYTRLL